MSLTIGSAANKSLNLYILDGDLPVAVSEINSSEFMDDSNGVRYDLISRKSGLLLDWSCRSCCAVANVVGSMSMSSSRRQIFAIIRAIVMDIFTTSLRR